MRPLSYLETSGTKYPLRHHNFSEELIPHPHRCENLKTRTDECQSSGLPCHLLTRAANDHKETIRRVGSVSEIRTRTPQNRLANQALCCLLGHSSVAGYEIWVKIMCICYSRCSIKNAKASGHPAGRYNKINAEVSSSKSYTRKWKNLFHRLYVK
jgi:hypothetical protein